MRHSVPLAGLALLATVARLPPAEAVEESGELVSRLMRSSVCIVGEVPGGKLEASGFVVPPGNTVLTTAHGLEPARNLRVKLADGRVFPARIDRIGSERADLALLVVVGAQLPPATLGSVEGIRPGDPVVSIGCPSGFEFTVTKGVVSSVRQSEFGYPLIQSDVPVNPGSSGGPLFDAAGRVVGIIKSAANQRDRIHFALPIDLGRALLEEISRERRAYELFNEAVLEAPLDRKIDLYRKALELDPDLLEAHYNLGLALKRLGRTDEAEQAYRAALRVRPEYWPASLNLGVSLYERGRIDDAVAVYGAALVHDRDSVPIRNNLAEAYRAVDRDAEARKLFQAILAKHPDYAKAHYGLALVEDKAGNRKKAAEHFRRYLALSPGASDAARVREWLDQNEGAK